MYDGKMVDYNGMVDYKFGSGLGYHSYEDRTDLVVLTGGHLNAARYMFESHVIPYAPFQPQPDLKRSGKILNVEFKPVFQPLIPF